MNRYCCFKIPTKKYYLREIKNPLVEIVQQLNKKYKGKNFNDSKINLVKHIPPNTELRVIEFEELEVCVCCFNRISVYLDEQKNIYLFENG